MTFAEADVKYEEVRQQYLAGALSDEQFHEQLHRLMVMDDGGRWWAKSRENGTWHYYDGAQDAWVAGTPPVALPPASLSNQASPSAAFTDPQAAPQAASPSTETPELPKWAAVKPSAGTAAEPEASRGSKAPSSGAGTVGGLPGTAQGVPATASYNGRDFSPLPELSSGMKVLFYILSLLLPLLGVILYFVYRKKPNLADRTAARAFLVLGILSIVFSCMCSTTFYVLESAMLGTVL